eukprot:gene20989-27846_t
MPGCFGGASMKRSPSEPHPVWSCGKHNPESDNSDPASLLEAVQEGSVGFSFSGGGFLLAYHVGAYRSLLGLGLLTPGSHVAGSSAGALIAACISSGLSPENCAEAVRAVAEACQEKVAKNLSPAVQKQLEKFLPEDAHKRCTGCTHIGITKLKLPGQGIVNPKVVSKFASRAELVSALLASSHIPYLSNGSITSNLPIEALQRLKIPNKEIALTNIQIAMGLNNPWDFSIEDTFKWSLSVGDPSFYSKCIDHGERDVVAWATQTGVLALLPVGKPCKELPPPVNDAMSTDIQID